MSATRRFAEWCDACGVLDEGGDVEGLHVGEPGHVLDVNPAHAVRG